MKLFLIIFFLFNASLLYSQDSIDEIIVKAELTDKSLYRLPITVTEKNEQDNKKRNDQKNKYYYWNLNDLKFKYFQSNTFILNTTITKNLL